MKVSASLRVLATLPVLLLVGSGAVSSGDRATPVVHSGPDSGPDNGGADALVEYVVQPGDTFQSIAARGLIDPAGGRRLAALNGQHMGARLAAGMRLRVPAGWLKGQPVAATVVAWRGEVAVGDGRDRRPTARAMPLHEGDVIETAANSYVTLALPDGSLVSLPSSSRIRIVRLRHMDLTDSLDRRFQLERGRADNRVTPMVNPASRFLISTPVAVAAVRGTKYQLVVDPDTQTQLTAVIEGKVGVYRPDAPTREVLVLAGFGVRTTTAGSEQPMRLLPAPAFAELPPDRQGQTVSIRVAGMPGATGYRVELAADPEFVDRFAAQEFAGTTATFEGVEPGQVYVRVAAIDQLGLAGLPAQGEFTRIIDPELAAHDRQDSTRRAIAALGAGVATDDAVWGAGLPAGETISEAAATPLLASLTATNDTPRRQRGDDGLATFPLFAQTPFRAFAQGLPGGGGGGGGRPAIVPEGVPGDGEDSGGDGGIVVLPDDPVPPVVPPGVDPAPDGPGSAGSGNGPGDGGALVPVPEASVWLLLIAGFGVIGLVVRRRAAIGRRA